MKILDISKNFFGSEVYPGESPPKVEYINRMETGDIYNLSYINSSVHTATHIDSPKHFINDGDSIDSIDLERFYGACTVISVTGLITGSDIDRFAEFSNRRILFKGKGKAFLTESAAFALADYGFALVGTDAISISPQENELNVHKGLLIAGIPILENLDLINIKDGDYVLAAFPIKLNGLEAAPVRAVLIQK